MLCAPTAWTDEELGGGGEGVGWGVETGQEAIDYSVKKRVP